MAVNSDARIWSPYKELSQTVEAAVLRRHADAIQDLEVALRKHKPDFICLLQNPAKNKVHREAVKNASTVGIQVQGQPTNQILEQSFIEEALIISDLFDLNEFAAVELLLAGELQKPFFPGLTRGLVAVLLYYDGRRCLVNALRTLIQSREGRTWTLGLNEELLSIATKFTDQLIAEGLAGKILTLLDEFNLSSELEKLQKERALGNARHRRQVQDILKELHLSLAECLFCWSCQQPLSRADLLQLLAHLRNHGNTSADSSLDNVTLALLMSALYSIDVRILDQEDAEDIIQQLPILSDPVFIPDIHKEMTSEQDWGIPGLKAVVQFGWAVTLRALSQQPSAQSNMKTEYYEEDELVLDRAIDGHVFQFLCENVVKNSSSHSEEFYLRQIHNLVTDFIVHMPLKVKDLRNRGDETARIILAHMQEGLEPPASLPRDFEHMLYLLGEIYDKDPLGLELGLEFWCLPESSVSPGMGGTTALYHYRPPHRQISLYKFVRLAGDLLPPSLYIPYIHMLKGLSNGQQSAHHCFNLLKTNASQASIVSWDHFFMSFNQYYSSLRQEMPTTSDLAHIYRHSHPRGITAQEMEGLVSVLQLVRRVAEQDEAARIAMYENTQWLPGVILLGLVNCSVPPQLKAELLRTLAAFSRSPEIAASLWQSIEVSQILPTVNLGSSSQPAGIQVELDEVEARNEEFPMIRAFLALMNTLTDITVPAGLGAGYRAPGFEPYLEFLRDSVLLKFNTRAYRDPAEKWEIASSVLEIICKLLKEHEVSAEDFVDQYVDVQGSTSAVLASKSPAHSLLVHLLNDTGLLKMVLYVIDEAGRVLEQYHTIPGQSALEKSALYCLNILDVTLDKQPQFLSILRESGVSLLVSPLDKLLLGINPRSGKADHLVNIAKYIMFNASLPEHTLYAVKILCRVCKSSLAQPELVGLFTADQETSRDLLHGFVESLETDDLEDISADEDDEEVNATQIRSLTRQHILKLLLYTLDQPAPNIAHYLLGFELRKPVSKTTLQDPGILGSPRTCLHSILLILNRGTSNRSCPSSLRDTPQLAELAYHLLYCLCANKDTSAPTMRYLRTTYDFLDRHLQFLPFPKQESGGSSVSSNLTLNQQSWLLKCVSIELRLTSVNRQRSHTQRLVSLLLDDTPVTKKSLYHEDADFSRYDMETSTMSKSIYGTQSVQTRRKLLCVLDSIDFKQDSPSPIQLEFFDWSIVEQVVRQCEQVSDSGVTYCDVKLLHRILMSELNNVMGTTAAAQRPLILQEIQGVLAYVVGRNQMRESIHAKRQALEAWRQVAEVILSACPSDLLHGEERQTILFELLHDLLVKVSEDDVLPELTAPVAGVILTMMANLCQCFMGTTVDSVQLSDQTRAGALDSRGTLSVGQTIGSRMSSLQLALKGLVEHIMRASSGLQRVRANLYGALLYYLQIAQKPKSYTSETGSPTKGVESLVLAKENECEKLSKENMATILSCGENFMAVVCRDACDGHHVGRMLALATLDYIVQLDRQQVWLNYLSSKGYMKHLAKSVKDSDSQLQATLTPDPEPLKALYIYESKMGLLTRIAQTARGAQMLLDCGMMARLVECEVYDMRPESNRSQTGFESVEGLVPTVMSRYRQILLPALKLCVAIMTSLGIENRQASSQVLHFIIAHMEVFAAILRERHSTLNSQALQELALTTAVVSRAAVDSEGSTYAFYTEESDMADIEVRGHVMRLQNMMIALLPRFCSSEHLHKQLRVTDTSSSSDSRQVQEEVVIALHEVVTNVVNFCRAIVSQSAGSSQFCRLLFGPNLVEALARDSHGFEDSTVSLTGHGRRPNLGLVVYTLRQSADQFLYIFDSHKQHVRKLGMLADLASEELKELSGADMTQSLSTQQRQSIARRWLAQLVAYKSQQLQLLHSIVENCLFILWRHLEYYLVHCVVSESETSLFKLHTKKQQEIRRLQDPVGFSADRSVNESAFGETDGPSSGVSRAQIEQLKADSLAAINDSLMKKLQEIEQCYSKGRTHYGFTEALIRRIKRLLRLHTAAVI